MFKLAFKDIFEGLKRFNLWSYMSWQEIVIRYRRSVLGPLWITASTGVYIIAISVVFSSLFNQDFRHYLVYMSIGIVVWNFINQSLIDSTECFIANAGFIKQIAIPKTVFIFQTINRNLLFLLHNLIIIVICFILFDANVTLYSLLHAVAGMAVLVFNIFFFSIILSCLCTRFMDLRQIIFSMLQIGFLITPVMWMPTESMKSKMFLLTLNPFFHFLDLIRQPLLPLSLPDTGYHYSLHYILLFSIVNVVVAMAVFSVSRKKIPYWV